jgi:hypothetical protein
MTLSQIVSDGYATLVEAMGKLGFAGAAANVYFGAADIIEGIGEIRAGNDFDGSIQIVMGVDEVGAIGIAGTVGLVTGDAAWVGFMGDGVVVLFGLAATKFIVDGIIADEQKEEYKDFLENGVSNGESYLVGQTVEEDKAQAEEIAEWADGNPEADG